jgi:hypothetical protein
MPAFPAGSHERTTVRNFSLGGVEGYRASQHALILLPSGGVGFLAVNTAEAAADTATAGVEMMRAVAS